MDPPNGLSQQAGHREHGELRELVGLVHRRDRVGHDDLVEDPGRKPLDRWSAEDGVGGARDDTPGALVEQDLATLGDGASRVDHVVHHDRDLALHVSDDVHHLSHVVPAPPLVDDRQRSVVQKLCKGPGPGDPSDVRGHDDQVVRLDVLASEVLEQDGLAEHVVDGDVKVADALQRVEVEGKHAVGAGLCEQVGDELGRDGLPTARLPVRPGVSEVGHDRSDVPGGRALARVDHDQQLHQRVVGGRAGGLDEEDVAAADGLLELDVGLPVRELLDVDLAELHAEVVGNLRGERLVAAAGEDLQRPAQRGAGQARDAGGLLDLAQVLEGAREGPRPIRLVEERDRVNLGPGRLGPDGRNVLVPVPCPRRGGEECPVSRPGPAATGHVRLWAAGRGDPAGDHLRDRVYPRPRDWSTSSTSTINLVTGACA
mmetsp:Transcript_8458/g.25410  ORF Transcript_8458/g.25410 Transcript_8458/m.25410 type:complete len:428 (-) Transcript_8458:125-1408(-)